MGALGWKGDGNAVGEILFCSHQLLLSHFSRLAQGGEQQTEKCTHSSIQYIAICTVLMYQTEGINIDCSTQSAL
jgi:hypothetical protein